MAASSGPPEHYLKINTEGFISWLKSFKMFCTVMAYSWEFIICNNKSWSSHSWCKYGKQVAHRRHIAHSQRSGSLTVRSKQAVGLLPPWNGHLLHIFTQLYPRCPVDLHQLKKMKEIMKVKSTVPYIHCTMIYLSC